MAYDNDQNEPRLPLTDSDKRKSENFLPRIFRTPANSKFLNSTMDQMINPGVVEKLNSYVGRKTAKAYESTDSYLSDVNDARQNYQLEPASIIKDTLGNVTYYKDYNDYINGLNVYGSQNKNHDALNAQEIYAWDPHIDWDKFSNFREYYWMPRGPQSIQVTGQSIDIDSTYTIRLADNVDNVAYVFSPDGLTQNPTITLYRGQTYRFDVDTPNYPFTIKTKRTLESGFDLDSTSIIVEEGVSVQNLEKGVSTLKFTTSTPDVLYYVAENDINISGQILVKDIEEATFIDVEKEIVGKRFYKTSTGTDLSNGMRLEFAGEVTPAKYASDSWFVEGVGDKIKLIAASDLNVPTDFTDDFDVEFDAQGFDNLPFSKAIGYPQEKDYIVINRSSKDGNLWSRYNRWFHRDVIEKSAAANDQPIDVDQSARAKRPIIEFDAGIKLYNLGTQSKKDVDLVDDYTKDVFSTIEGGIGYSVDGTDIAEGMRILFTADTDIRVKGKIFKVTFINFANNKETNRQIHLVEESDATPIENEVVLALQGTKYKGKLLSYINGEWKLSQSKDDVNQEPMFDVFDSSGNSYSDSNAYSATNFVGTKLFSYKKGTGTNDSELGFAISYKNLNNVGDIVFNFDLLNDSFTYTNANEVFTKKTDVGYLKKYTDLTTHTDETGWIKVDKSEQYVIRQFIFKNDGSDIEVDSYENSADLTDLELIVLKNNVLQFKDKDYTTATNNKNNVSINFIKDLTVGDSIIVKTKSATEKTDAGYYEIPASLEKNPLNNNITEFTLGEVNDHVSSIVELNNEFSGIYPGNSNLRDLGNVSKLGRKFVQHSVPMNLLSYNLLQKENNVIDALEYSRQNYANFKKEFLTLAEEDGFSGTVKDHVDYIIGQINKNKTDDMPFYFTDMLALGGAIRTERTIIDADERYFPLQTMFTLDTPSNKSVTIYNNGVQLVHGKDYTFNNDGYIDYTGTKSVGDKVEVFEYETTNGSYIPATPTKLGLYPKYQPKKYADNTYLNTTNVIQGHDGSITVAFDDYRDDLLLELEKRIYNNCKVAYNVDLFDIHNFVPGHYRDTTVSRTQINNSILNDFNKFIRFIDQDYTENSSFERTNPFTFNFRKSLDDKGELLPGHWRQIYVKYYDTDRPHTHPWEMLGFSAMPSWWETQYGPAPYTENNLLLWQDIADGIVREPNKNIKYLSKYSRNDLLNKIPVNEQGELKNPLEAGLVADYNNTSITDSWTFGDGSPVETAWRKSSSYPFSLLKAYVLNKPAEAFATGFDRINQIRNSNKQIVYKPTELRFTLDDIVFPVYKGSNKTDTSGLINYIFDYITDNTQNKIKTYKENIVNVKNQLGVKLAGFTDKDKFRLVLDSRTPTNEGNVFVPDENYDIFLNTSGTVELLRYSGVIIQRKTNGYLVKGYDDSTGLFKVHSAISRQNDPSINVGGISEPYVDWASGNQYVAGQNVLYEGSYYRTKKANTDANFSTDNFTKLANLPLIGGRDAFIRRTFTDRVVEVPYGTLYTEIQDVVDFLLGYQSYLESQGFEFDLYEGDKKVLLDFRHSVNEFLFWTTQNWGENSVITLSPAAQQIKVAKKYSTVDNIFDGPFGYSIKKADGERLQTEFATVGRDDEYFVLSPKNTADGIFNVAIPLVQKEHVCIIDNATVFGDTIYDLAPGYRQERIKILGYRTQDWNGSLSIPGFVYDEADTSEWQPYKDYAIGSIVKHKEFYYSANEKVAGSQTFNSNDWVRLAEKPQKGLYPNLDYKVNQFADYYDLDSDNFDTEQQRLAQHLIGYQKRKYLENIINDDVSQYKFYQGMIQEKGTKNALTKLFDALASADKDSLEFYEEWAIKDGQYGAAEGFDEFELLLDESKFRLNPQPIVLTNTRTGTERDLIYRILPHEVYQKSKNYDHTPFPGKYITTSYTKQSGYVSTEDVLGITKNYEDISLYNFADIPQGNYIWVGNKNNTWGVYKHITSNNIVERVGTGSEEAIFYFTDNVKDIVAGDIIGIHSVNSYLPTGADSTSQQGQFTATEYDLDAFYKVKKVQNNEVTVEITTPITEEIENCVGSCTLFQNVRVADVSTANSVLQTVFEPNDLIWIDDTGNDRWKVLINNNLFDKKQQIISESQSNIGFTKSIAVDERNTTLVVGAPDSNNGKVYVYTRPADSVNFVLSQTLEDLGFADDDEKFGSSVDISADGKFIIVGSPEASNVKTKYSGDFVTTQDYGKNSIVRRNEQLWRAKSDIKGATDNIVFDSFGSTVQNIFSIGYENSQTTSIPVIFVGNYAINTTTNSYAFPNTDVDHILIRVPKEIYEGSGEGYNIKLAYNTRTYANQDLAALEIRNPFDGEYSVITEAFLEQQHSIYKKIDVVLYVNAATNIPRLGDTLKTDTATAVVDYVHADGSEIVIYLKDLNGSFNTQDSLFRDDGDFIGEFVRQAPDDGTLDTQDEWGGYWMIQTPVYTPTILSTLTDEGRGLVYYDVDRPEDSTAFYYYNSLDYTNTALSSENTINAYIRTLSNRGLPGAGGTNDDILSPLFVVRAPADLIDDVTVGDSVNLYVNQLQQYNTGDFKDLESIGLSSAATNRELTIYDIWDGYINIDFTELDVASNPFEPRIGQIVRDTLSGATGEVAFLQRDGLNATLFLKNVTGTWREGDDYGQNTNVEMLAIPTDPRADYRVDQIIGQTQFVSLGYAPEGIGKMLVFDTGSNIIIQDEDRLVDVEYWLYSSGDVLGIPRAANIPSPSNNEWEITFRIPAESTGTGSGLSNEGLYTIYSRARPGAYDPVGSFTVPEKAANFRLGAKVSIAQNGDFYKGYVGAAGNQTSSNPGRLYFLNKGVENNNTYDWEYAKDKNFKGSFNEAQAYFTGDVVYLGGALFKAKTNIAAGVFDANDWTSTDDLIDYIGYIPNDTTLRVINDSTFDSTVVEQQGLIEFASKFDRSKNGKVVIVNAIYDISEKNRIVVYRETDGHYQRSQDIFAPDTTSGYGADIAISNDGMLIAVGAPFNDDIQENQGLVYIYKQVDGTFVLSQTLKSRNNERAERFGTKLDFDGDRLVISAKNSDALNRTTFDGTEVGNTSPQTTFDSGFTAFKTVKADQGVVYCYENIDGNLLIAQTISLASQDMAWFGENVKIKNNHVYVGSSTETAGSSKVGTIYDFANDRTKRIWQDHRVIKETVDVDKIKKVFLYNTKSNQLLTYLDYIDPIQGKVAGPAEQELTYKLYYDPATYTLGTGSASVDPTSSWGPEQVGEVWWDLTNAKFYNAYQGNVIYSTQNWNRPFVGSEVEVYEWVESDLLPSEYDAIADTDQGIAKNISGNSKYGNDTYSVRKVYDEIKQTFSNKYYFWVKGKKVVPDVEFRQISIDEITQYITDPVSAGHKFAALISPDSFILHNCENLIEDNNVAISVQYWTIENQTQNVHNQYQLLAENLETSQPKNDIIRKWFDSLIGYDEQSRPVPDPTLSPKQKYGTLNFPRQSWFVNRTEALKQVIERVNSVLKQNLIVESKDLTALSLQDPILTEGTQLFDTSVDTVDDLGFVGVAKVKRAKLTPIIENGKIVRVEITEPGRGYRKVPKVTIHGKGTGAELTLTIDSVGKISSVTVKEQGRDYEADTLIAVRRFAVLVESDSTVANRWALYERLDESNTWNRIRSQSFNTEQYWDYADWYDTGFSDATDINHTIDNSYLLSSTNVSIGETVKIQNVGTGGWLLLQRERLTNSADPSVDYKTIGRQKGTIQLSSGLYDVQTSLTGFDTISFDTKIFDNQPTTELRIILNAIKDDLFINDLLNEFNKLFFASLRQVFTEQLYVDWAFKTSFVKAQHNVGELRKDITFNNDNLPSYEDYIQEVKPFATKVREYLSAYERVEQTRSMTTDFDLAPFYDTNAKEITTHKLKIKDDVIIGDTDALEYPDKNWLDNYKFEIVNVEVSDTGKGYTTPPVIKLTGGGGSGAKLRANLGSNGRLTSVDILNKGSGYTSQPDVEIVGNLIDSGQPAKISVQIGNSPVRVNHTKVKFDRVTGNFTVTKIRETQTFTGSGSQFEFELTWPIDLTRNTTSVTVSGTLALKSEYTVRNKLDTTKGYDRYVGVIEFTDAPAIDKSIVVEYNKSIDLLDAADRINQKYDPAAGMPGKEVSQLMTGVDYGGVQVKSFSFNTAQGFDTEKWYDETWDSYDTSYEDEVFEFDGSSTQITLSKPLEDGVTYNVYKNGVRLDDPNFDGSTIIANQDAIMEPLIGDGSTKTLYLDDLKSPGYRTDGHNDGVLVNVAAGDVLVIRKSTSDGTFLPDENSFDTLLSGGSLNYSTARGLAAEEIIIDGDDFVSKTTSAGPEEQVPGQILDSVDIQVYEKPRGGSSFIASRVHTGDGSTKTFDIGYQPIQSKNMLVKIGKEINADYTVNYKDKTITFTTAPASGEKINILALSESGSKLIDVDSFVADGSTGTYTTKVNFESDLHIIATLDGIDQDVSPSENTSGKLVLSLATPPSEGSIVRFAVFEKADVKPYSEIKIDEFTGDGTTLSYPLSQTPFTKQPGGWFTIVQVGTQVLNAGFNQRFVCAASTGEYTISTAQITKGSKSVDMLRVFLNDKELEVLDDFLWISDDNMIRLLSGVNQQDGDILDVYVLNDGQYRFGYFDSEGNFVKTDDTLYLDTPPNVGQKVKVYQFSNHDSQNFERLSFKTVSRSSITVGSDDWRTESYRARGLIELRDSAIDSQYVWVIKNNEILSPNVHYYVTDNKRYVQILGDIAPNDEFELIHFTGQETKTSFGWRQFKDMLNRTHYKRLDSTKDMSLANDLNWYDQSITIINADSLPEPDQGSLVPGIVFINGERIEYFVKNDNVLSQLRRGTLGTGTPEIHSAGSTVFDQSTINNVPYTDELVTDQLIGDGTSTIFVLPFTASNPDGPGSAIDTIEVFVSGKRQRKNSISSYRFEYTDSNDNVISSAGQDSPEGDVTLEPDFTLDGNLITFALPPKENARITIVRKQGQTWKDDGQALSESDSDVAKFLRARTVDLPR